MVDDTNVINQCFGRSVGVPKLTVGVSSKPEGTRDAMLIITTPWGDSETAAETIAVPSQQSFQLFIFGNYLLFLFSCFAKKNYQRASQPVSQSVTSSQAQAGEVTHHFPSVGKNEKKIEAKIKICRLPSNHSFSE